MIENEDSIVRGALLTKFFSQFQRGCVITYIGGSTSRYVTINQKYEIKRPPWSEKDYINWIIEVENDRGYISVLNNTNFEETSSDSFEKWLKEN